MKFKDLQQKIHEFVQSKDSLVSEHIDLTLALKECGQDIPDYVRAVRVAFLSNFTLRALPEIFSVRAVPHNLHIQSFLAPYNQYAQTILDPKSELYSFNPHLIYLCLDSADSDATQIVQLIDYLLNNSAAKVVICVAGLKEVYKDHPRVAVFDFDAFLGNIGKEMYWNTKFKDLGDLRLSLDAFPAFADSLMGYAIAAVGAVKKCLVLDLDNTLWQGIVGEDGYEGIIPNRELQTYIQDLFAKGVLLTINSKNNPDDALEVITKHPDMVLQDNHFASVMINWDDKALNIQRISDEISLGIDSFVFVDDDEFQREHVWRVYPQITVLHPNDLYTYPGFFSFALTEEDVKRGSMYAEERQRKEFQSSLRSVEDFLRELNLRVTIQAATDAMLPRIAQLTQKTNQFNMTTRRYSVEEIKERMHNGWQVWTVRADDRFGEYGIVGVAMVIPDTHQWRIDNFLFSCRVLGRGIEKAFLAFILQKAKSGGAAGINGEYIPTSKNKLCEHFYSENAFSMHESKEKDSIYGVSLTESVAISYPEFIEVNVI